MSSCAEMPLDSLSQFMAEVRAIAPLAPGEDDNLIETALGGGTDQHQAHTRLVESYQPLVIGLAKKYAPRCKHLTLLDLVQEGNLGLLEAIKHHNGRTDGVRFSSWAYVWIRGAMVQAIWRLEQGIRIPPGKAKSLRRFTDALANLSTHLGRALSVDDLAQASGMPRQDIIELLALEALQSASLESLSPAESFSVKSRASHDAAEPGQDRVLDRVRDLVEQLPDLERAIMKLRYGFDDGISRTHREVANMLDMSSSRVDEIDGRVRIRIRKALSAPIATASQVAA
jgi:RNA polymerase nonessential primary-like sigma factor